MCVYVQVKLLYLFHIKEIYNFNSYVIMKNLNIREISFSNFSICNYANNRNLQSFYYFLI